ncbi:MAG TPA: hypothetical protein PLO85_07515 [Candidatus Omnitrophota bacterium]|nr:hypothetical protein [Candidatus Omnitrophota bacterium]
MPRKQTFQIDRDNRLIIKRGDCCLRPNGSFSIGANNSLIYTLNETPAWRATNRLNATLQFEGTWQLDNDCNLMLRVGENGDKLVLAGRLISCDTDSFVFEITSRDHNSNSQISILRLTGVWQTDENSSITFSVQKKRSPDTLVLEGAWHVDAHNRIVYRFTKTDLKRKQNISNTILFEGHWQITAQNQLTYFLERSLHSGFNFKAQLESPSIRAEEGVIKYRLGAGFEEKGRKQEKILTLYGAWRFSNSLTLDFDISYTEGKIKGLGLEAQYLYTSKDSVVFAFSDSRQQPMQYTVTFSHRFLKKLDSRVFITLKHSKRDSGIEAGVQIPF